MNERDEEYIKAIEEINRERIKAINKKEFILGQKIYRLKEELLRFDFKQLVNHLKIRITKKNKQEKTIEQNMSISDEINYAKLGDKNIRVAIYTCIVGKYDEILPPMIEYENCDYYLISDDNYCEGWIHKDIGKNAKKISVNSTKNRYVKFHPFEYFEQEYDYAIYLDGNITPLSDLSVWAELINPKTGIAFHKHCSRKSLNEEYVACINNKKGNRKKMSEQIEKYINEGMPDEYGLLEGNAFICDLHSHRAKEIFDEIWNEFIKCGSGRDQIVLPYIFWKNNILISDVARLGSNVWRNTKLFIRKHKE